MKSRILLFLQLTLLATLSPAVGSAFSQTPSYYLENLGGANSALLEDTAGFSETAGLDPLGQDFCVTGTHHVCLPITVKADNTVALPLLGGPDGAAFGDNGIGEVAGTAQTTDHDPSCLVDGQPVEPFFQILQAVSAWKKASKEQRAS